MCSVRARPLFNGRLSYDVRSSFRIPVDMPKSARRRETWVSRQRHDYIGPASARRWHIGMQNCLKSAKFGPPSTSRQRYADVGQKSTHTCWHIPVDLERSGQNLTRVQGHLESHVDPSGSCYISGYTSWQDEHNRTRPMSVALSNSELLAKPCWCPRMTSSDPRWPLWRSLIRIRTWIMNNSLIQPIS